MKVYEILNEWGRIVKGVNTTPDVDTSEIKTQAAKFGNTVDKDGKPPTLSSKIKGSKTNVLYNLGLTEGVMLKFQRGEDFDTLHIKPKGKNRVELRGKPGYERGNYDAQDKLHQVLDNLGKAANFAELMNGETVSINPNHPDGERANKTAQDILSTEAQSPRMNPAEVEASLMSDAEKRKLAGEYEKLGMKLFYQSQGKQALEVVALILGGPVARRIVKFLQGKSK
jgi:hypothetical protein